MITNELFLEESKKIMSQAVTKGGSEDFIKLVEKFQGERLERLKSTGVSLSNVFSEYLPTALNEVVGQQNNKQEKFFFESVAQSYTGSALIAYKLKLENDLKNSNETDKEPMMTIKNHADKEIERLMNSEKKNGHKFHTIVHDYIKTSQEYLYDHKKISSKSSIKSSVKM